MDSNKKYWKGLEELKQTPDFKEQNKSEFAEPIPLDEILSGTGINAPTPRRDFLKTLGFGLGAVSLAACQPAPVKKAIPYLVKPEEIVPGVANYYKSSYNGASILVKTREGRPIKVEGNPACPINKGGLDAQAQASVLDLYDTAKLKGPQLEGKEADWDDIDQFVKRELNAVAASGKKIKLISSSINSPSAKAVIAEFITKFPTAAHINVDAVSYTGIIKANENSFGKPVLPQYRFDRANVIVSFGADFLGTWISPVEFTKQYVTNRNLASLKSKRMSRHIQFESNMSLTGTNADSRITIKPSQEGLALLFLYNELGGTNVNVPSLNNPIAEKALKLAAKELIAAKGNALVVSGSNDVSMQTVANAINALLGSYSSTIDLDNPTYQYLGNDAVYAEAINEMKRGEVGAVFFMNANPAYSAINAKDFSDALKQVKLRVALADRVDETAALCNVVATNQNYLESWGDANAAEGYYTLVQPTINPIFNSRGTEESLLNWSDNPVKSYYQFVKRNWETNVLPASGLTWKALLQKGFVQLPVKATTPVSFGLAIGNVAQTIINRSKALAQQIEVQLYQSVALRDGKNANNPLLQEMPDPVSKVTWDNYIALNPKHAEELGFGENEMATVKGKNYSIELPVLLQPGQMKGTAAIALGYGRVMVGKAGNLVGKNAFPFLTFTNGTVQFNTNVTIEKTGGKYELAQTQTHHSYEGRNIIREASFADYKKDPYHGSGHGEHKIESELWDDYEKPGFNWVMAIDLNACTGCGACVVACNTENNIPVVGKDEVRRRREMHWIRIDRYYSYNEGGKSVTEEKEIDELAGTMENVSVVYQPMLCQHCEHAPCETVCPVLATVHSSEGLNHMAYNRCIGTRYCANNCPYKVRRFNWFNYWNDSRFDNYLNNEFTQLVLNPDVTTRSRGVMEKCSMCIQRIQEGKLKAKVEKRPMVDGDVKTACQQTCPANAIVFGDANDPNSEVSKALKNERTYYVLEEINVRPGIGYQTKITNTGLQA